jgi:hypothetical protein
MIERLDAHTLNGGTSSKRQSRFAIDRGDFR